MQNDILYVGTRDRAYRLMVGLMSRGIDVRIDPVGGCAVLRLREEARRADAVASITEILPDVYVGKK